MATTVSIFTTKRCYVINQGFILMTTSTQTRTEQTMYQANVPQHKATQYANCSYEALVHTWQFTENEDACDAIPTNSPCQERTDQYVKTTTTVTMVDHDGAYTATTATTDTCQRTRKSKTGHSMIGLKCVQQ